MRKSILCLLLVFVLGFALIGSSCKDSGEDESSSVSQTESLTGGESESYSDSDSDKTSESTEEGKLIVKDKSKTLFVGETYGIEPTSEGEFTYSSTDEAVAVVSDSGVVTAISDGVAFIEVSDGKTTANVKISVIRSVEYIRLGATVVGFVKGGEKTVKAEVIRNGEATDDEVTFSCESEAVKLVKNGKSVTISASAAGYYTVIVSCGEMQATITVKVVSENAKLLATTESTIENCVTLKWNAVENADGYEFMVNGGGWSVVNGSSVDVTSYTQDLKYGETVVFAVRAVAKSNYDYFDGLPERIIFSHDYAETVIEPYTCVKAGKVKYTCNDCGKNYEQDEVYADHKIKNGACEVCGKIITEKIRYIYDEINECYYVGGADAGFDSEEVYILAEYDDGKNGRRPVRYFGISAFAFNETIKKVVIPASITEFKDVRGEYNNINKNGEMLSSPFRGLTFDACTNLEFVSMEGITYLPAIDSRVICDKNGNFVRNGSEENLTEEEISKGYTAKLADYGHDTFRDCYNLTTLIVGDGFYNEGRSFMNWLYTPSGFVGQTDIYVNGEVNTLATDSYPIGSPSGANNNLLTGDVFHYEENSTKCFTWYYDADGNFVSNGKHEYNRNGVCKKCYALNDKGVKYVYYAANDCYYVGDNRTIDQAEIEILSEYDDGIHGLKPVTFVQNGAFRTNQSIRKVILPESVTTLDGSVFELCPNLEYVSMTGISDMAFRQIDRTYGKVTTNNNFLNCFSLKTVIVGKDFNLYADSEDAQQFIGVGDEITVCADIFVNAKKSVSDVNCGPSPKNNILTGRIYYKGDLKRCGEWTIDADGNIITSEKAEHAYENGICKHCGEYETYGVNYLFDEAKNVYYIASYTGKSPEMKVLGEYNDGEHGVKSVGYVKNSAFIDNSVITKVVFPESVKRLEGSVFQGCLNLEYVSMTGVEELTLENLSNSGIYGDEVFSTNNFLNCGKLKVVIVGKKFKITNNHFIRTDDSLTAGLAEIYMSGTKAECEFTYNPADRNELLSGVVYYQGDLSRCQEWKFNADGTISTSAKSHNYVDNKCVNCGDYETHGVSYLYNESKGVYYVSGYIGSSAEVTVLAKYDDGTHGEKDVKYVGFEAFKDNAIITKVILPSSVDSLEGSAFLGCTNLEYVSMTGVKTMNWASVYNNQNGDNNFRNCNKLKYVIIGSELSSNCGQFNSEAVPDPTILEFFVNGTEGKPNLEGNNALWTGNVYYKVDDNATVKCLQWKYGADGEIVKGASSHDYVDGKCSLCGAYNTMGVAYGYDSGNNAYYVADNRSLNLSEVTILEKYNDGTNGEASVIYVQLYAFHNNTSITKITLPESVTELDGSVFMGCTNLKYVSMTGVKTLNYSESVTRPYSVTVDGNTFSMRYGNNNFYNCVSLETVIVSNAFSMNVSQFGTNIGSAVAVVRLFVNGASGTPSLQEDKLLTGEVYYKADDTATVKCLQWKFGENGEIVKGASSHTFVDGKCSGCGKVQTEGLLYALDEEQDCYYVSGYNGSDKEIYILSEYNGKPVTYIKNSAFFENTDITKVILPTSIKRLDGGVFQGCGNLEYVSMLGIEEMLFAQIDVPYTDAKVTTNNNFIGCTKLTVLIVGEKFNLHPSGESYEQQFLSQGNPACIDVYVYGTSVVNCSNGSDDKNGLLTGNVYYYSETESENSWRYVDGVATKW